MNLELVFAFADEQCLCFEFIRFDLTDRYSWTVAKMREYTLRFGRLIQFRVECENEDTNCNTQSIMVRS